MIAASSGAGLTAAELFNGIFNASLVVMLITLITSLGMTFSVQQIVEPAKRGWLLAGTIVVNTLIAPLIAIGVCELLPLSSQGRVGALASSRHRFELQDASRITGSPSPRRERARSSRARYVCAVARSSYSPSP